MAVIGNAEVRKQSDAVSSMAEDWPLIDALLGGTKTMRHAGEKYLPPEVST
jgi:hypothetical protein